MNHNSKQDLFIYNFPTNFVPKTMEDKYGVNLVNMHKPYASILDYLNSNILDINMPGLTFPTVEQTKPYGKVRKFRGSISPYDVYQKELNITMKFADFHFSYFVAQEAMMNSYIRNRKKESPFIDDFVVTILDEEKRELFKMYFQELTPNSQSDFRLSYANKAESFETFTLSFFYNKLDIEWIPRFDDGSADGELIDDFYDDLIINDPANDPTKNFPLDKNDENNPIIKKPI